MTGHSVRLPVEIQCTFLLLSSLVFASLCLIKVRTDALPSDPFVNLERVCVVLKGLHHLCRNV